MNNNLELDELLAADVAAVVRATSKLIGHEDLLSKLASYCYVSGRCQGITEALQIDAKISMEVVQ